jgi:hypothetical protein
MEVVEKKKFDGVILEIYSGSGTALATALGRETRGFGVAGKHRLPTSRRRSANLVQFCRIPYRNIPWPALLACLTPHHVGHCLEMAGTLQKYNAGRAAVPALHTSYPLPLKC